jgi:rod shape-determining protein MreC
MNVRILGKGVTGTLTGAGVKNEYEAKFRFLYKNKPVMNGDVVVTSGHDQVFPSGLEVGRILSSEATQSGIYYLYDVTPTVNFSTLEEVFVLLGEFDGEVAPEPGGAP